MRHVHAIQATDHTAWEKTCGYTLHRPWSCSLYDRTEPALCFTRPRRVEGHLHQVDDFMEPSLALTALFVSQDPLSSVSNHHPSALPVVYIFYRDSDLSASVPDSDVFWLDSSSEANCVWMLRDMIKSSNSQWVEHCNPGLHVRAYIYPSKRVLELLTWLLSTRRKPTLTCRPPCREIIIMYNWNHATFPNARSLKYTSAFQSVFKDLVSKQ